MEDIRHFCRKCTAGEGKDEYFSSLSAYIENLDPELTVSDAVYKERLMHCEGCQRLTEGMCRSCGCFVMLRAVMQKNNCPWGQW
jgi:hypothetical protein